MPPHPRQRFHLADKLITAREFNAHVRPARTQYAHTILMMKFTSRALYVVPRVRVQSEVYFGLYTMRISCYWRDMSLAAQFLIGCLLPSIQQQEANTAPFHTEQT